MKDWLCCKCGYLCAIGPYPSKIAALILQSACCKAPVVRPYEAELVGSSASLTKQGFRGSSVFATATYPGGVERSLEVEGAEITGQVDQEAMKEQGG